MIRKGISLRNVANRWTTGVDTADVILERAIEHLSERGPVGVHPNVICDELDISRALVNYHFGGRDGLIGQAMVVAYERYVDLLWEASEQAGDKPLERLMAWIDRQVEWTRDNAGLAVALNFPYQSFTSQVALADDLTQRLTAAGSRNFDNLQALVRAAAEDARGKAPPDPARDALDAAAIGWLTLGMSVWNAGRHLPTQAVDRGRFPIASEHVHKLIAELLAR